MKKIKDQTYQQELEDVIEEEKKEGTLKSIIFWIFSNIKFLLIPGSRIEELSDRESEYERTVSKRKFIRRLKSPLTIIGIFIIITIVTIAVFGHWISPYTLIVESDRNISLGEIPAIAIELIKLIAYGKNKSIFFSLFLI